MNFVEKGVYGDENMPDVNNYRTLALGTRESPNIDLSEAFTVLDEINSGKISWFSRPIQGNEIDILTSMDSGNSWDKMINGQYIQNVKQLNDDPFIKLRYVIRSYISMIIPENSPKVYSLVITLSDKEHNTWDKEVEIPLEWNEVS